MVRMKKRFAAAIAALIMSGTILGGSGTDLPENVAYASNAINVVTTNDAEESEVEEEVEDIILSDLATEDDYKKWSTENGWDYYHGGEVNNPAEIEYDSENQRIKVTLDYSANSESTWSEAKVKFTPSSQMYISKYNQFSIDFIYPDSLDGTKMKFYSDGVIEKDVVIDESKAEDLGNGMKKVTVTMVFSPSSKPFNALTVGIVGCETDFQGEVYLDNLVLSKKKDVADFVEITETPGEGSPADISKTPESITLADENAADCAKALFTYLSALKESDQVLFGHQNDVSKQVSTKSELGDVYEVTGQVSGVFGIDSLALADTEAGGTDAATALANSVAYSKTAAENGAIISLSTHMPNFSNTKVVKNDDGTYSFFGCNFDESKDLSNDIVKQILPGGEYHDAFNAYLDIIADYATQLQEENIPILFRPFHENTGNWFWWGSANTPETYKSLFRYTKDYMEAKGVHNMLYVYSPGGPVASEEEYLTYYPGDEYVDILAFDFYDDYNVFPATADDTFMTNLDSTCSVVSSLAEKRGKLAAISECGVRVMKEDGSDNEGLLVTGNPVGTDAAGKNWYMEVSNIAKKYNMPYYLVWANFSDTNFYVPYKYDDTYGQELINDFIQYYNDESSVFGADTNFYSNLESLAGTKTESYSNVSGYMVYPFDASTILDPTWLTASVKNAEKVQFVITDTATGKEVTLDAASNVADAVQVSETAISEELYSAELTQEVMDEVGKTDVASITLVADGNEIATLTNVSLGKEKDKAPAYIFDDFDYYSGSNGLIDSTYTANSAAGCSSTFTLSSDNVNDGNYGGAFNYYLETTGSEVWTGRIKFELVSGDFSAYNAIQMWVKPDGNGQKLVIQLTDISGEEFEVFLSDFVKGTEAQYVTVPFSSFKGKNGGTLDTANLTKFAVWCNSIIPEDYTDTWIVDSTIYFDGIKAVSLSQEVLDANPVDDYGLIITDEPLAQDDAVVETEDTNTKSDADDAKKADNTEEKDSLSKGAIAAIIGAVVVLLGGIVVFLKKKKK